MSTSFANLDGRRPSASFKCVSHGFQGSLKPTVHFKVEYSFDRGSMPLDNFTPPSYIEPVKEIPGFMTPIGYDAPPRKDIVVRRYSEFRTLYMLLVYLFPMVVVPPLPEKSIVSNMQTARQDERTLKDQQRNITRFLNALLDEPALLFSHLVVNFITCAEQSFPGLMENYRVILSHIESNVKKIEELKQYFAKESAQAVSATAGATQMIGGFFGSIKKMANGRVSEEEKSAVKTVRQLPDVIRLEKFLKVARFKYQAFENAATEFQLALVSAKALEASTANAASALDGHRDFLGKSGVMPEVAAELKSTHEFVFNMTAADTKSQQTDEMYVHVYVSLIYESQWYKSMANTIEFFLALRTFHILESQRVPSPAFIATVTNKLAERINAFPVRHEAALRSIASKMAKVGQKSCQIHHTLLLQQPPQSVTRKGQHNDTETDVFQD